MTEFSDLIARRKKTKDPIFQQIMVKINKKYTMNKCEWEI